MISGEELKAAALSAFAAPFDAILMLSPSDGAPFFVDARQAPTKVVDQSEDEPDCRWYGRSDTLMRVLSGQMDAASAFLSGRLKVAGDMSVMARMPPIKSGSSPTAAHPTGSKSTAPNPTTRA